MTSRIVQWFVTPKLRRDESLVFSVSGEYLNAGSVRKRADWQFGGAGK